METNYAQDFDLNIDLHSVDVNDVAPPTIKLGDAKHYASLLSNFLLKKNPYILVLMKLLISQKLAGNLDKMIIANLGGNTINLRTPISRVIEFFKKLLL